MSIDLPCDWTSGFVMDPTKKQRVGYLLKFDGLNMGELAQDIRVFTPYGSSEANYELSPIADAADDAAGDDYGEPIKAIDCVGVIDSFSFGGGVGDPISISAYISAQNAELVQGKLKTTLETTVINKVAWWIFNFDAENKVWFEEAFPLEPAELAAQLNAPGGSDIRLAVANEATRITPNIDINVVNIFFELIPAADSTYVFHFATSAKTKFAKGWGLKIGANAADSVK